MGFFDDASTEGVTPKDATVAGLSMS